MEARAIHFTSSNSGATQGGGVTVLKNLLSWAWPCEVTLHVPGSASSLWADFKKPWLVLEVHPDWKVWEFRGPKGYGPGKPEFCFDRIPEGSVVVLDSLESVRQLVPGLHEKRCLLVNHVNSPDHCLKRNPIDSFRDLRRYRKLALNICVSRFVRDIFTSDPLARMFLRTLAQAVVYSGIPLPEAPVVGETSKAVYFGRYEAYKNPLFLLELGCPVVFAGSSKGCSDPVEVPKDLDRGWVADKADVARLGDIFVFPSDHEAFGLAVIEMMGFGKVPICFDSGAFPEIVTNGVNGFLVPSHDAKAARQAFDSLISDPDLLSRMSRAAFARAQDFALQNFGVAFYLCLKELADS